MKRKGITPISDVTGKHPFKTAKQACPANLVLDLYGGPHCVPETNRAKVAIRPPLTVIGFDVDDGYNNKSGGDTLVNAEMQYGPLPGTYSLTARGPDSPSRRMWFRIPDDLIVMDSFFGQYGGFIETVRTGHRYSWAPPGYHIKNQEPIVWYDKHGQPCELPNVQDLPELPPPWVKAIRESTPKKFQEAKRTKAVASRVKAIEKQKAEATRNDVVPLNISNAHLTKAKDILYSLEVSGGEFRNAVFNVAWGVARVAAGVGQGKDEAVDQACDLIAAHPNINELDSDDLKWIEEGVIKGFDSPWMSANPTDTETIEPASAAELKLYLDTYTRSSDLSRLGRRTAWARAATSEHEMLYQSCQLIKDSIAGYWSAKRAVKTIQDVYSDLPKEELRGLVTRALRSVLDEMAGT